MRARIAPCRCGHPGLGCYCWEARLAEYEEDRKRRSWKFKGRTDWPRPHYVWQDGYGHRYYAPIRTFFPKPKNEGQA